MSIESEEFEKDCLVRSSYRKAVDVLDRFGSTFRVRTLPISVKEKDAVDQLLCFVEFVERNSSIRKHDDDEQIDRIREAFGQLRNPGLTQEKRSKAVKSISQLFFHKISEDVRIDLDRVSSPENLGDLCCVLSDSMA